MNVRRYIFTLGVLLTPSLHLMTANADTFNTAFGGTGYAGMGGSVWSGPTVAAAIVQPDEKIIVTGYAKAISSSPTTQIGLARFLSNGELDTTFANTGYTLLALDSGIQVTTNARSQAIALDASGNIIVAGYASNGTGQANLILARFLPNGTPDSTFGIAGTTGITSNPIPTSAQPTGYVGTVNGSTNGSGGSLGYETLLLNNQLIGYGVAVDAAGKIVVVGQTNLNCMIALRFLSTGALDTSFGTGTVIGGSGASAGYIAGSNMGNSAFGAYAVTILDNGKILVAGYSSVSNAQMMVVRLTSAGLLDTTFNASGISPSGPGYNIVVVDTLAQSIAKVMLVQTNGYIDIAGYSLNTSYKYAALSARYTPDGLTDLTYGSPHGYVITQLSSPDIAVNISGIAYDPAGKIVLTGYQSNAGVNYSLIIRYNLDGTLDTTFSSTGYVIIDTNGIPDNAATSIALRNDGTLLLGASLTGLGMGAISFLGGGLPINQTSSISIYGQNTNLFAQFLYINSYAQVITDATAQAATIEGMNNLLTSYALRYANQYTIDPTFNYISYLYLNNNEINDLEVTLKTSYPESSGQITIFFRYIRERILHLTIQEN